MTNYIIDKEKVLKKCQPLLDKLEQENNDFGGWIDVCTIPFDLKKEDEIRQRIIIEMKRERKKKLRKNKLERIFKI